MKHSCARLAPKHVVADAEAAEQWPRKEADEATGRAIDDISIIVRVLL